MPFSAVLSHALDSMKGSFISQGAAIEEILQGGDVLLASHTGSGKTLAYLLPVVKLLSFHHNTTLRTRRAHLQKYHGLRCTSGFHMCGILAGEAPQRCGGTQQ